jgi:carbonic anhydrase
MELEAKYLNLDGAVTADFQKDLTPSAAVELLKSGHQRFKAQNAYGRNRNQLLEDASGGQHPYAVVLGCIDSRAPVELVFDASIGDLFVARVAGNVVNTDVLGSLEYACKYAGAKAVLVLGHTQCGAVSSAWNGVEDGNITGLLEHIQPSVAAVQQTNGHEATAETLNHCAAHNVDRMCNELRAQSEILRTLESDGAITIIGGMYDVAKGEVNFHGSH